MSTTTSTGRFGTRWRRVSGLMVIGLGLTTAMGAATFNGVLGFEASLAIINSNGTNNLNGFSMSASRIQATDAGFGMAPVPQANGTWKNVLRAGFSGATITGLCLMKSETLPVIGDVTIGLTIPSSAGNITANNGIFDISDIAGDTTGTGLSLKGNTQVGLSTADITTVSTTGGSGTPYKADPMGANDVSGGNSPLEIFNSAIYNGSTPSNWVVDGKPHTFGGGWTGIDAGAADLSKVSGRLWQAQLIGAITMPQLKITVTSGQKQCASWPSGPPYTNTTTYDGTNLWP